MEDSLKILETERASLKNTMNIHEIDHMSDLHADNGFHKKSMKIINYFKVRE